MVTCCSNSGKWKGSHVETPDVLSLGSGLCFKRRRGVTETSLSQGIGAQRSCLNLQGSNARFIVLHSLRCISLQVEGKTLHQQKDLTCFVVIPALLRWSGPKATASPRSAWVSLLLCSRPPASSCRQLAGLSDLTAPRTSPPGLGQVDIISRSFLTGVLSKCNIDK